MILNENFNIKNGTFRTKAGKEMKIAFIDPATSENTYQYKDKIKTEFGAVWLKTIKAWGWFLGDNPRDTYENKIKPCLEFLTSVEHTEDGSKRDVIKIINQLLMQVESAEVVQTATQRKEEIQEKLKKFKQDLINAVSSEEFKKLMEPIIKFKRAQGHQFSISNSILVWIQDPKATMVKSRRNWEAVNREVKRNAPAICLWVPVGQKAYSKDEKEEVKKRFLASCGVKSEDQLSIKQKENLKIELKGYGARSFNLVPCFFDYRFTIQMEGKEDMVGDPNADIPWYDDSGEETPETKKLVDAMCKVIENSGVKLNYVEDLGGARGVSKSGAIDVLSNVPKNIGLMNTLTHEFSHELLHQRYLKETNKELADYFVGTKEGRGKVEQQAELSAWIVLRNFGYDMPTNVNYVGIWGLNQDNAAKVFDSVTKVAEYIVKNIDNQMKTMEESRSLNESFLPNGYQLAKMLGFGEIYKKSKQKFNETKKLDINSLVRMVESTIKLVENKKGLK